MTPEALAIETMFKIVTKSGGDDPFELNTTQRYLDDHLTGRDIIPKARQLGVSSYFLARYVAACLIKRNVRAVIVSHETDATQRLFDRCRYYVSNMRGPNPEVGREGLNTMTFPKTNSQIYIGTAGSRKFGRGDTITHLLCSEYAYWPHPKELLGGLLDAVPQTGEIAIESTGKGVGNDYHRRAVRAAEGKSQWSCHFFNWLHAPEYSITLEPWQVQAIMDRLDPELEEPELVRDWRVSAGQIMWRRMKLEEKDYDLKLFKQEFPLTLDECFQASGDSIFHKINFQPTSMWRSQGNHLWKHESHPMVGMSYVIGADPAGGTGGDNSCAQVFCLDTQEQVAEYAHNRIEPDAFGHKIADLSRMFYDAFCVVEANNHGPVTLGSMRETMNINLIYNMETSGVAGFEDPSLMQMGFRTTGRTKPIMIGKLRTALATSWTIHSEMLSDELSTFIEHENGALAAQDDCHDDRVMAAACAMMGVERAGMIADGHRRAAKRLRKVKDPFVLDDIIDELHGKRKGSPLKPQHASAGLPALSMNFSPPLKG